MGDGRMHGQRKPYLYIHMYTFIISTIHECIHAYIAICMHGKTLADF